MTGRITGRMTGEPGESGRAKVRGMRAAEYTLALAERFGR